MLLKAAASRRGPIDQGGLAVGTEGVGRIEFVLQPVPPDPPSNDDVGKARDLGKASIGCDGEWIHRATAEAGVPYENPGLPKLLPHLGGWKLQWRRNDTYLTGGPGLPIVLRGKTSTNLTGPWSQPAESEGGTSYTRFILLPGPTRGFARLELQNPNRLLSP